MIGGLAEYPRKNDERVRVCVSEEDTRMRKKEKGGEKGRKKESLTWQRKERSPSRQHRHPDRQRAQ
jgi:hypothetical protein